MALYSLYSADVPLINCSLNHGPLVCPSCWRHRCNPGNSGSQNCHVCGSSSFTSTSDVFTIVLN